MPYLKAEAPSDVAQVLKEAEARADDCWRGLQIRHYPTNVAIWAQLTGGISAVEREQAAGGSNTPHFDMVLGNLGRLLPVAVKWAMGHGLPPSAELTRQWTGELSAFVASRFRKRRVTYCSC
jgi:hypothetical protein